MYKERFLPAMLFAVAAFLVSVPTSAYAMEVGAWVPWFGGDAGVKAAIDRIDKIDVVYPFVYEIASDGAVVNRANFDDGHWEELFNQAKEHDVKVIPTVAWFDGEQINTVLSDKTARKNHIEAIVSMVESNDFDGEILITSKRKRKRRMISQLF